MSTQLFDVTEMLSKQGTGIRPSFDLEKSWIIQDMPAPGKIFVP